MAQDQNESVEDRDDAIEDADDQEEDTDEDESDDDDSSDDEDEDESEDDEDNDESDSNDDDNKPVTRKELREMLSKRGKNRDGASRRVSKKGKDNRQPRRDDQTDARIKSLELSEEKRQVGHELGLSPGEVDIVYRFNGGKKPTTKTLKDPVVKGALDGYRTDTRRRQNTPHTKPRITPLGSKKFNELPPAERRKHFGDRRREILEGKKG